MQRAFEKVKERLENIDPQEMMSEEQRNVLNYCIEIVNQVAEEYAEKEFSEWCHDCPAYDKENHHCPRLCKVIRTVVDEIKEGNNSKWIPISSGNLPDENTKVWCINADGETMAGCVRWDEDEQDFTAWGRIGAYNDWMPQVVAWM